VAVGYSRSTCSISSRVGSICGGSCFVRLTISSCLACVAYPSTGCGIPGSHIALEGPVFWDTT
jgi:hypothetical protein